MLLNPSSRRGSYSVPVHINLQSVRRRPDRQSSSTQSIKEVRSKGDRGKTQAPISSVGEDRAILLGLSMIGFSLLMYFLFGILIVNPCLRSFCLMQLHSKDQASKPPESCERGVWQHEYGQHIWSTNNWAHHFENGERDLAGESVMGLLKLPEHLGVFKQMAWLEEGVPVILATRGQGNWTVESNCTVIEASFGEEREDSAREFKFPCLNVTVYLSRPDHKAQLATLYYNEDALDLSSKCFYRPKYRQNTTDVEEEADRIYRFFRTRDEPFTCFSSQNEHHLGYTNPGDAILTKKCDSCQVMQYMSFSTLMLVGGVMTISLVRLNQYLSHMVAQFSSPRSAD